MSSFISFPNTFLEGGVVGEGSQRVTAKKMRIFSPFFFYVSYFESLAISFVRFVKLVILEREAL